MKDLDGTSSEEGSENEDETEETEEETASSTNPAGPTLWKTTGYDEDRNEDGTPKNLEMKKGKGIKQNKKVCAAGQWCNEDNNESDDSMNQANDTGVATNSNETNSADDGSLDVDESMDGDSDGEAPGQ